MKMKLWYWQELHLQSTSPILMVVTIYEDGRSEYGMVHSCFDETLGKLFVEGAREISAQTALQFGWPI